MQIVYRIAADLTVCLHLSYVLFIVLGQVGVMAGAVRGWKWVRNTKFRLLHLIGILIVVAESWLGITCPLTTLEHGPGAQATLVAAFDRGNLIRTHSITSTPAARQSAGAPGKNLPLFIFWITPESQRFTLDRWT
jgi:hypothetical protein